MQIEVIISLWALLGMVATVYAIYVEHKKKKNPKEKLFCDISNKINCGALTSDYSRLLKMAFNLNDAHLFNIPNTYLGGLFYFAVFLYPLPLLTYIPFREFLFFIASTLSIALSVCLACILYFKLKEVCPVCVTTYVINAAIFYCAVCEFFY